MAIQFLRGSGHSSTSTLAVGQPYYDTANSLLFMGVGSTSTLAELNSITYNASRWLQTGYLRVVLSSATSSRNLSLQFFTDTVYTDTDLNSDTFFTDHVYECVGTSGVLIADSTCYNALCTYVNYYTTMGYCLSIYYASTDTYSTSISSVDLTAASVSTYGTFRSISAKKVTSN